MGPGGPRAAYGGGAGTACLGLLLHYLIAFMIVATYSTAKPSVTTDAAAARARVQRPPPAGSGRRGAPHGSTPARG